MAEKIVSILSASERDEVRKRTPRMSEGYRYTYGVCEDVVESVLVMVEEWAAIGFRRAAHQPRSQ